MYKRLWVYEPLRTTLDHHITSQEPKSSAHCIGKRKRQRRKHTPPSAKHDEHKVIDSLSRLPEHSPSFSPLSRTPPASVDDTLPNSNISSSDVLSNPAVPISPSLSPQVPSPLLDQQERPAPTLLSPAVIHPARSLSHSSNSHSENSDPEGILVAPNPSFAKGRRSRPASFASSTGSVSPRGGQVQLGGRQSPSEMRNQRTSSMNADLNAAAQEELLSEDDGKRAADPYAWERPLESVQRVSWCICAACIPSLNPFHAIALPHLPSPSSNIPRASLRITSSRAHFSVSTRATFTDIFTSPSVLAISATRQYSRMYDTSPLPTSAADRRASRLPPGVSHVDPFGFGLTNDPSPYDSALIYGSGSSPSQSSIHQNRPGGTRSRAASTNLDSPYPSSSNMSGRSSAISLSSAGQPSSAATSPLPWTGPEADHKRRASMGDLGPGWQSSNSRASRPVAGLNRSKLSGEIQVDTTSQASDSQLPSPVSAPLSPSIVPSDHDYTTSRLFQRTLKAQKALEKERAKGKLAPPVVDKRKLAVSDAASQTSAKSKSRRSLGWFRSSSEVALPSSIPLVPQIPNSPSASQLPTYPSAMHDVTPPLPSVIDSSSVRARKNRTSSSILPQTTKRSQPPTPTPSSSSPLARSPLPSPAISNESAAVSKPLRQRSTSSGSYQSASSRTGSRAAQVIANESIPPSPAVDTKASYATRLPTNSTRPSPERSNSRPSQSSQATAPSAQVTPGDATSKNAPSAPSPPSSESSRASPTTPTMPHLGPSLPPGAGPALRPYEDGDVRKSSFGQYFGGAGKDRLRSHDPSLESARAPTPIKLAPKSSFFGRSKKTLAPTTEPLQATIVPSTKLTKVKGGSFFSMMSRSGRSTQDSSTDSSMEDGRSGQKALPPVPAGRAQPAASKPSSSFAAKLKSPRQMYKDPAVHLRNKETPRELRGYVEVDPLELKFGSVGGRVSELRDTEEFTVRLFALQGAMLSNHSALAGNATLSPFLGFSRIDPAESYITSGISRRKSQLQLRKTLVENSRTISLEGLSFERAVERELSSGALKVELNMASRLTGVLRDSAGHSFLEWCKKNSIGAHVYLNAIICASFGYPDAARLATDMLEILQGGSGENVGSPPSSNTSSSTTSSIESESETIVHEALEDLAGDVKS
ncbi:hypothetical protein P7C70_g999, partial [Phenoliferia sp. Uapishka_3]